VLKHRGSRKYYVNAFFTALIAGWCLVVGVQTSELLTTNHMLRWCAIASFRLRLRLRSTHRLRFRLRLRLRLRILGVGGSVVGGEWGWRIGFAARL